MTPNPTPPGWYEDPTDHGQGRFWDGTTWTESVMRSGALVDLAIDPSRAQVPPVPGTEVSVFVAPSAPPPPFQPTQQRRGSSGFLAGLVGLAVVVLVVVVLVVALTGDDAPGTPPRGDDAPPATKAPPPADEPVDG